MGQVIYIHPPLPEAVDNLYRGPCPNCSTPDNEVYTLFQYTRCPGCGTLLVHLDGITADELMHPERYDK